jgi:hypothetical protein
LIGSVSPKLAVKQIMAFDIVCASAIMPVFPVYYGFYTHLIHQTQNAVLTYINAILFKGIFYFDTTVPFLAPLIDGADFALYRVVFNAPLRWLSTQNSVVCASAYSKYPTQQIHIMVRR